MSHIFDVEIWFGRMGPGAVVVSILGAVAVAFCVLYTFDGLVEGAITRWQASRDFRRVHPKVENARMKSSSTGNNVDRWA